jgi:hypothetical protein
MTRANLLQEIDQLRAVAIDKFGLGGRTPRALRVAYDVCAGEIKEIEEEGSKDDEGPEPRPEASVQDGAHANL